MILLFLKMALTIITVLGQNYWEYLLYALPLYYLASIFILVLKWPFIRVINNLIELALQFINLIFSCLPAFDLLGLHASELFITILTASGLVLPVLAIIIIFCTQKNDKQLALVNPTVLPKLEKADLQKRMKNLRKRARKGDTKELKKLSQRLQSIPADNYDHLEYQLLKREVENDNFEFRDDIANLMIISIDSIEVFSRKEIQKRSGRKEKVYMEEGLLPDPKQPDHQEYSSDNEEHHNQPDPRSGVNKPPQYSTSDSEIEDIHHYLPGTKEISEDETNLPVLNSDAEITKTEHLEIEDVEKQDDHQYSYSEELDPAIEQRINCRVLARRMEEIYKLIDLVLDGKTISFIRKTLQIMMCVGLFSTGWYVGILNAPDELLKNQIC